MAGDSAFDFTAALHSYWSISSIDALTISGDFAGKKFLNKMADPPALTDQASKEIQITEETDAVYEGAPALPNSVAANMSALPVRCLTVWPPTRVRFLCGLGRGAPHRLWFA